MSKKIEATIWKHVKSGGLYSVIATGLLEADLTPVTIYKSLTDSKVWVRPTAEFEDGRFTSFTVEVEGRS